MVDMSKYEIYEHPVYNRPWGFKEKGVECHGDNLVAIADKTGENVNWTNFGAVLNVKEVPGAMGSVMSTQALALYLDGSFKFHNSQLQEIPAYADTPSFVLFECVKALAEGETGCEIIRHPQVLVAEQFLIVHHVLQKLARLGHHCGIALPQRPHDRLLL